MIVPQDTWIKIILPMIDRSLGRQMNHAKKPHSAIISQYRGRYRDQAIKERLRRPA
jgi:hypothetical protein